jgi:hypothetical protein
MALAPSIFISATSSDLHSTRDVVAKLLTSMGYTPVWQDMAATDAGNLKQVLQSWIGPCAAVIQLVGFRYGAEPLQADAQFGRVSYTELEALYAEQMGKKVIYIFLPENFPTDPCEPESEEKRQLQLAYRQRVKESGALRHSAASVLELENRVLRMRDELAILRAQMEKGRRRIWFGIGVALVLLLVIGVVVIGLRQSSMRLQKTSEDNTKVLSSVDARVREIQSLSAPARADLLDHALASANTDELFLLSKAGITASEIEESLARKRADSSEPIAASFFKFSKKNRRAIDWLKTVLKNGVDPNMTVPDPYFEQRTILLHAMKAGNADATIALIEAGASPHPYQGLWLTTNATPAFLFPYSYLLENEAFDAEEKRRVAKAIEKAGAAITRYQPGVAETTSNRYTGSISLQRKDVEKVLKESKDVFGFSLEESAPLAKVADSQIANAAGKAGERWTKFLRDMPLRIVSQERPDFGPFWVEVRNFIGTYFERGYFIGVALQYSAGPEYALIEVSKDFRTWNVYVYIGPRPGLGHFAKDEKDPMSSSYHLESWQRFDMKYFPESHEMLLVDYYKYSATRDMSATLPLY